MSLLKILFRFKQENIFKLRARSIWNDYSFIFKKLRLNYTNLDNVQSLHIQFSIKHRPLSRKYIFLPLIKDVSSASQWDSNYESDLLRKENLSSSVIHSAVRFKSTKKKSKSKSYDNESSSDEEEENETILESGKNFRDIKARVPSLRMDAILKAGLGISRNKVEELFYSSKLRINKEKIKKKSISLHVGDTIDVVKSPDTTAEANQIEISRVLLKTISSYDEDSGIVSVVLRKYPKLFLNSYNDDIIDE